MFGVSICLCISFDPQIPLHGFQVMTRYPNRGDSLCIEFNFVFLQIYTYCCAGYWQTILMLVSKSKSKRVSKYNGVGYFVWSEVIESMGDCNSFR